MVYSIITPRYRGKAIEPLVKSQWLVGTAIRVVEYSEEFAKQVGKQGEVLLELEDGTYYEVEPDTVGVEAVMSPVTRQATSHPLFHNDKVNVTINGESQTCVVTYRQDDCIFSLKAIDEVNPYFKQYGITSEGKHMPLYGAVNVGMRIEVIPEEGEDLDARN